MGYMLHWRSVDDVPSPDFWGENILICVRHKNGNRRVSTYLFSQHSLRQIGWAEVTHWAPMPEPPELDTPAV